MFCPQCGNQCGTQTAPQSNFCSSCGAGVQSAAPAGRSRLVRPLEPRMLAGVCSGSAIHFGWDVAMVRIAFAVLICITTGCAIFFYIAAWIVLPEAQYAVPLAPRYVASRRMDRSPV